MFVSRFAQTMRFMKVRISMRLILTFARSVLAILTSHNALKFARLIAFRKTQITSSLTAICWPNTSASPANSPVDNRFIASICLCWLFLCLILAQKLPIRSFCYYSYTSIKQPFAALRHSFTPTWSRFMLKWTTFYKRFIEAALLTLYHTSFLSLNLKTYPPLFHTYWCRISCALAQYVNAYHCHSQKNVVFQ